MTVAELRQRMTHRELIHWKIFLARRAQREELEMMKARARARA